MDANERKQRVMDATMRIVAEKGLETFAVLQASKKAGVNEALVYRDFSTKENLLFECYDLVASEVAQLYQNTPVLNITNPNEVMSQIHDMWIAYFSFLVKNGYKTIYYQSYRDSNHIHTYIEKEKQGKAVQFTDFLNAIGPVFEHIPLPKGMTMDYIWTYIMDTSAIFAKRVIRKELPDTIESYENIWNLLAFGIVNFFEH